MSLFSSSPEKEIIIKTDIAYYGTTTTTTTTTELEIRSLNHIRTFVLMTRILRITINIVLPFSFAFKEFNHHHELVPTVTKDNLIME